MTVSLSSPPPSYAEDRFVVLSDPRPGTIVELTPGSQLGIRFRRSLGASRWHLVELPGHLLVLPGSEGGAHEFQFLVFGTGFEGPDGSLPLRLERRHPEREMAHEVCELLVVPVSGAARTSTYASPRTA